MFNDKIYVSRDKKCLQPLLDLLLMAGEFLQEAAAAFYTNGYLNK